MLPVLRVIGSGVPLTLKTRRSICALTVTDLLLVLLAVLGSGSVPETVDESVSDPPAVGVTTMVAKKLFEAGIDAQLHVTVPPDCVQVPPLVADEETYVEFTGRVLVSTVFVPCEVLWLKTDRVRVALPSFR